METRETFTNERNIMESEVDTITVYLTYENDIVTVEIEDGNGKQPYDKSFTNTAGMDPHDFCVETASRIEEETGKSVKWSMKVVGKQNEKSYSDKLSQLTREKPLVVTAVVVLLTAVLFVVTYTIQTSLTSSDTSSSSYTSSTVNNISVTSSSPYTRDYETTPKKTKLFEFGDGEWESNSMYNVFVGSVTNVSDETYRFVKVRGTFTDDDGNAIDTDTTYACGDEGLRPGETTKFTLSVKKDSRIKRIEYSVYDLQIE